MTEVSGTCTQYHKPNIWCSIQFVFLLGLKNPVSKTLYKKTRAKVQKIVKITTLLLPKITPICLIVPAFLVNFASYLTTDLDDEALELPLPKWFPFDTKNPIGFTAASIIEYLMCLNLVFFVMCIMIVATGPSLILICITEDMKCSLHSLDRCARMKENPFKLIRIFNEFIQFHSNTKQLSWYTFCRWWYYFSFNRLPHLLSG